MFNFTPNPGYQVASVDVDGTPAPPASSYTFSDVKDCHTIDVAFAPVTAVGGASTQLERRRSRDQVGATPPESMR